MSFLSSVAKVVGIAAAPFTGGSSLALTAAAFGADAASKNASAAGAGQTAALGQAQSQLEIARIQAQQADKDRSINEAAVNAQIEMAKQDSFFKQQQFDQMLKQQKEQDAIVNAQNAAVIAQNKDQAQTAAINAPADRIAAGNVTPIIIAGIIALIIFKMKGK